MTVNRRFLLNGSTQAGQRLAPLQTDPPTWMVETEALIRS